MKSFILLFLLLVTTLITLRAQETKFVSYGNNHWHKEFYVLKSNEDIRHGPYLWYEFEGDKISMLEQCNYLNGKKDGQWDYFYKTGLKKGSKNLPDAKTNSLRERIFYNADQKDGPYTSYYLDKVSNETLAQNPKRKKRDSLVVEMTLKDLKLRMAGYYSNNTRTGEWYVYDFEGKMIQCFDYNSSTLMHDQSLDSAQYDVEHNPIFLGGTNEMEQRFMEQLNPEVVIWSGRNPVLMLEFMVKRDGTLADVNAKNISATAKLCQEMKRVLLLNEDGWIPALEDGLPVNQRCILEIKVVFGHRKWDSLSYQLEITSKTL